MDPSLRTFLTSAGLLLLGAFFSLAVNRYVAWRTSVVEEARRLTDARTKEAERLDGLRMKEAERVEVLHQKLVDRVGEIEKTLVGLGQTVLPLNMAYQAMLIKELTHAHTPEMDALMVKLGPPNTLTPADEARLAVMLQERYSQEDPLISEDERGAAFILPTVVKRARTEALMLADAGDHPVRLRFVSVAPAASDVVAIPDLVPVSPPSS